MTLRPVILCGGSGTRLWPLSRTLHPKPMLDFGMARSLLQQALLRARAIAPDTTPILVCNEEHRFLVAAQAQELAIPLQIVLEPEGRNTAPAIALAALHPDVAGHDLLLVLPADQLLEDDAAFAQAVQQALPLATEDALVTFGVVPDRPHTGYGYIRRGVPHGAGYRVELFVEKPDRTLAETYLRDGGYWWNSGMFLFRAAAYLRELTLWAAPMHDVCQRAMRSAVRDLNFLRPARDAFLACPAGAIDRVVLECTRHAMVVPFTGRWHDLGAWDALHAVLPHDVAGNAVVGDAMLTDCTNCLIFAGSRRVAALGLQRQLVVETADAVLVAPLDRSQQVGQFVSAAQTDDVSESGLHQRVYRPWGTYECVDRGPGFLVKRLVIRPGAQLSLQLHRLRAEHWVVVRGIARITRGAETFDLRENESAFIPAGVRHRIENPGTEPLQIVEVQSGTQLDEADIVRFEDRYGRADLLQSL